MQNNSLKKVYLWIIKIGLWLIPLIPIYVSDSTLFPFITGKNFTFRILIETIFIFWIVLAVFDAEYRPRLTTLFKAVTIFTIIVFLADLLGPNPARSFFSNYERMEGFMMILHLYLFFIMLVSVFKKKKDWLVFLHSIIVGSLIVSYIALLQKLGLRPSILSGTRVDATIGNPSYLAAYLIFAIWLFGILIRNFKKNIWLASTYVAALIFELAIFYFTETRGAAIALVGTAVLFLAVLVVFWNKFFAKKINSSQSTNFRIVTTVVLVLVIITPVIFLKLKDTSFVKSSSALSRLTSISLGERTVQSRFSIWNMAWKGFKERPILGWGQENFYLVFQKYYNPSMFADEPWFDRSHDVIFDWLVHTGLLGLVAYLSILISAIWLLFKRFKVNENFAWEGLVLICLFISYFVQNLFVFDNLNTYIMLFSTLAYTEFLLTQEYSEVKNIKNSRHINDGRVYGLSIILIILFSIISYQINIKPIKESQALIDALKIYQSPRNMEELLGAYQKALSYDTFGNTEVREQLGNAAQLVVQDPRFSGDDKKRFLEFAISEMRKETSKSAKDVKHILFLSTLLEIAAPLNPNNLVEAESILQEALRLSPTKQPVYYELAQIYLTTGKNDQAFDLLLKAWNLDHDSNQAAANLWVLAILIKRPDIVDQIQKETSTLLTDSTNLHKVALTYQKVSDFASALKIYSLLVGLDSQNAQYHATYAALLANAGNKDEAKKQVEEAVQLDPSFKKESEQFLQMIGR